MVPVIDWALVNCTLHMTPRSIHPVEFFNRWFREPISVAENSVIGIIDALNRHPMVQDSGAQDYVMPMRRCREKPGRFRIFRENQDNFYCFVYSGDELKENPPVYFESCFDLNVDCGVPYSEIIDGDHMLVATHFTEFLWHMLGHHFCIRMDAGEHFADGVTGIVTNSGIELDSAFVCPLRREFPAGYTCLFSDNTVCAPEWGAAFLTTSARDLFIDKYSPSVSRVWP